MTHNDGTFYKSSEHNSPRRPNIRLGDKMQPLRALKNVKPIKAAEETLETFGEFLGNRNTVKHKRKSTHANLSKSKHREPLSIPPRFKST